MTGCINSNAALPNQETDLDLGSLTSAVADLLHRVTKVETTIASLETAGVRLSSPLSFPDGIGKGEIVAQLFPYRDALRLDINIEHNRFFALADDSPSDQRCFLNDYVASVTIPFDTEVLSADFVRNVVAGVAASRDAVRRHNRRCQAPWNEIRVAALEEAVTG